MFIFLSLFHSHACMYMVVEREGEIHNTPELQDLYTYCISLANIFHLISSCYLLVLTVQSVTVIYALMSEI